MKATGPDITIAPLPCPQHSPVSHRSKFLKKSPSTQQPETPQRLLKTLATRQAFVENIVRVTAWAFGLTIRDLLRKSNKPDFVEPRMYLSYILRMEGLSWHECGRVLRRHHATVINAVTRFDDISRQQPWRRDVAEEITARAAQIAGYRRGE